FIMGASKAPIVYDIDDQASANEPTSIIVSDSDGGMMTITAVSSDASIIDNAYIDLAGTGSNTLYLNTTAGVPQAFTMTLDETSASHGKVTITVTITDPQGLSSTQNFSVIILSPPGSGNALFFDGVDNYVDLGNTDALKQTGAFSYELWMYSSDWPSVVGTAFGNTQGSGYALYFNADTIMTNVYADGVGYFNANASKSILSKGWHHFAFTFNGQSLSLYIDGHLTSATNIGSNNSVYHHGTNSTLLGAEVGDANTATGAYVSVIIDELRFWNVARSAAEIRTNMCKKITGSETGLTAYYRFDNSSGTSLIDLSNNNNDGILNNMDNSNWVTSGAAIGDDSHYNYEGSSDNALEFDGSSNVVNLGDVSAFNGLSQLTVEAWVKFDSHTRLATILCKRESHTDKFQFGLDDNAYTGFWVQIGSEGTMGYGETASNVVNTGVWYHVAAVFDGSQVADADRLKLYIDGVLQSLAYTGTLPTTTDTSNTYPLIIGAENTSASVPFDGQMDELRIWTVARTESEINDNMNQ
ncbi:MAG: hypothetical protein OMM_12786, partial [Candidatus Magnetoglobus multicellularis str. Araruama]